MKKLFFLLLSIFALNANAQNDEVALEPVKADPGVATMMWVYINMPSYENELRAVNVDIQFPDGFTVGTTAQEYGDGCKWDYDFEEAGTATNWSCSGSKKTDNGTYYHFTVYANTESTPFHGKEGRLIQLKVKTPTVAGVYPVKVLASTYAAKNEVDADNLTWDDAQTSYVVVGEPTGASIAMEGTIPSFVNDALASEAAITTLDLSNVTVSNGIFTYVDGRNVIAPSAEVKSDVAYFHAAGANVYSSVCLPFDAQVKNAYTLSGVEGDYATFAAVAPGVALAANTPAIVGGEISVEAQDVVLKGVQQETKTSGCYLKADKFLSVNGSAVIPALRGWWDVSSSVKGFVLDGETAITGLNADGAQQIYNVSGIKQAKAQRGVNIVNGKKVVVK